MKKWLKFFSLSFFSDKISKDGARRGYGNVLLGLILALVFLWAGYIGGDMLPLSAHYNASPDFAATVRAVIANPDVDKRIGIEIEGSRLKAKKQGGEYAEALLVNTLESDTDRQSYSVNGYSLVIDTRPADTLAEIEAYCVSNDGKNTVISYEDYLTLSDVARLNFDFKLRYTGRALELDDETVDDYREYVDSLGDESKAKTDSLAKELSENKITKSEYNRAIYQLYFTNYYPEITDYESASNVPLLRNYYYHQYIKEGAGRYLFIFDDYMAGSFETDGGIKHSFYGFYEGLEDGALVENGYTQAEADRAADNFIKKSFGSVALLSLYAYAMNIFSLIPFIALMPMVVTLLAYSILKLRGVEGITSLGGAFKIIGSYVWFSGVISAALTVITAFFVQPEIITTLPLLLFFAALAIRSVIFAVNESKSYIEQSEQRQTVQTEV